MFVTVKNVTEKKKKFKSLIGFSSANKNDNYNRDRKKEKEKEKNFRRVYRTSKKKKKEE